MVMSAIPQAIDMVSNHSIPEKRMVVKILRFSTELADPDRSPVETHCLKMANLRVSSRIELSLLALSDTPTFPALYWSYLDLD